jgi:hypothetical protein
MFSGKNAKAIDPGDSGSLVDRVLEFPDWRPHTRYQDSRYMDRRLKKLPAANSGFTGAFVKAALRLEMTVIVCAHYDHSTNGCCGW